MRLTVLGSAASYAGPGQACAGHLVEGGGARVLFDAGNGVIANLARVMDPAALDAVFVTHHHPDHFLDLYALQALLRYAPQGPAAPLALYLPEGLYELMKRILSGRGATEFDEAFVVVQLAAGEPIRIGELIVTPRLVPHTEPTFALVAEADGAKLVYTSDTGPGDEIVQVSAGADLLLCEATLPEEYAGAAPHLTASQAAEYARRADVRQLVLSHIWPTNDRDMMLSNAENVFGGPVALARELDVFDITPKGTHQ
jgi:ribonuclease BN (tRNA processing enzyme)